MALAWRPSNRAAKSSSPKAKANGPAAIESTSHACGETLLKARHTFGRLLFGLLLASLAGACTEAPEPSLACPDCNVILLLADTLRADRLGIYGYDRETSPNLDRLSRQGVRFLQARSQAACTFPSVNSLLTSQPTFRFTADPGRPAIPPEVPTLATLLAREGFDTAAISASPIVRKTPSKHNPVGGYGQGFAHFDESCEWLTAGCVTGRAVDYLDRLTPPFFLYLHYMDPHDPYRPGEPFSGRFAKDYEGERDFVRRGNPNPIQGLIRQGRGDELAAADIAHLSALYDEEILAFDKGLGDLFRNLETRGLLDSSIILLASDHGEAFYEHSDIKHCRGIHDNQIRVPLIFWMPGIAGPIARASPVSNLDIVPTLLDYLGLDPKGSSLDKPLAGRSLRPVIESEELVPAFSFSAMGPYRSVNNERYKLVHHLGKGSYALFDILADPKESRDLLADRGVSRNLALLDRAELQGLKKELLRWMSDVEGGVSRKRRLERAEEIEEELRSLGYLG